MTHTPLAKGYYDEPEYASDHWASKRGYELATVFGSDHKSEMEQADEIAAEFRQLRDTLQARIATLLAACKHTPLAKGEQLWSDDALAHLAVDLSVGGKPQNVYAKLKIVRDDMQARLCALERVPYRTGAAPAATGVPQSIAAIIEAALNKMWAEAALDGDFVTQTSAAAAQAWLEAAAGRQ